MPRLFIFLAVLIGISACSPKVSQNELSDFAKRSEALSAVFSTPAELQTTLIAGAAENTRFCHYLSGRSFPLLPSKPDRVPSQTAQAMARFAVVLAEYTGALAEAANGKSLSQLTKAATGLKKKLGAVSDAGPVFDAVGNAFLRSGEAERQARIRLIMEDVLTALLLIEDDVISDAPKIVAENKALLQKWESSARCVLGRMRQDRPAASEYFARYSKSRSKIEAQILLSAQAPEVLEQLIEAHILAASAPDDLGAALEALKATVADAKTILDARRG